MEQTLTLTDNLPLCWGKLSYGVDTTVYQSDSRD